MSEVTESLAGQTSRSVLWMTAQKWLTRVGGLATMMVLTRLLTPEDFGLAAAASGLLPLVYVLSDVGFSTYIVQADELGERTSSTAFWFSLATGIALAVALVALASPIAALLGLPALAPMVSALAVSMLFIALGSVPLALLRRRMQFRTLAAAEFVAYVASQGIAILVALLGGGAWALIVQLILSQVVVTVWVWPAAHWRPRWEFSRDEFRAMGGFGVQVAASGLISVARVWTDNALAVIGLGVRELGHLNVAARLVSSAQDLSAAALTPVSMAAFAQVSEDRPRLRSAYLRASAITHAAVAPLLAFIGVTAPVLVPFLFGEGQETSATVTPALVIVAFLNLGIALDEGLLLGLGRARLFLIFAASVSVVGVAVTAVSVRYGVFTLIWAWVGSAAVQAVARVVVVGLVLGVPVRRALLPVVAVAGPTLAAAVAGEAVLLASAALPAFISLAASGTALAVTYLAAMRILRPRVFADTLQVLPGRFGARLARLFRSPRLPVPEVDPAASAP